ncbi:hypothetical protein NEOKW01_0065 [Nematocida sp. AWRm80]|nr:hypothetical protein NEOKW01_0065 [Nematocida sp. AWRm80]
MTSVLETIRRVAQERYRDISEQRLKRYKVELSPISKLILITVYSAVIIALMVGAEKIFGTPTIIEIDYSQCTRERCDYSFRIPPGGVTELFMYTKVNYMPQTHMAYRRNVNERTGTILRNTEDMTETSPGIARDTYPDDEYEIHSEEGTEVPIDQTDTETRMNHWRKPSSFGSAFTRVGKVDGISSGEYRLSVFKNHEYIEPSRSLYLVFNLSPFGSSFQTIRTSIIIGCIVLVIINSIACLRAV